MFPSPYGVSFILMSLETLKAIEKNLKECFRLLTEYHSFLLNVFTLQYTP